MNEDKYFLVETESKFKVKYLVHATDLTPDQAQQLINEGLVEELSQDYSGEEVLNVSEATPELIESLNLPLEVPSLDDDAE